MKRYYILFVVLLFSAVTFAQKKVIPNNPDYEFQSEKNKTTTTTQTSVVKKQQKVYQPSWSFGGNIGFSFWNGGADVLIAPKAYYHFTPKFIAGIGASYYYSKFNGYYTDYTYNSFGGSVLGIFKPFPYLQLSAEFQELYTNRNYNHNSENYWIPSLYLGASFVTGHVAFGMQYDVLYDSSKSPYSSAWGPVISFYF